MYEYEYEYINLSTVLKLMKKQIYLIWSSLSTADYGNIHIHTHI